MAKLKTGSSDWESKNIKNTRHVGYWTSAWVVTIAILAGGPRFLWDFDTLMTILAVLVNLGAGVGMIWANKRQVAGLDEMQKKIFLEAGALTLGVGLVFGGCYQLLEDVKLIGFEPEIAHLIILMSLTFGTGLIAGNRKYR